MSDRFVLTRAMLKRDSFYENERIDKDLPQYHDKEVFFYHEYARFGTLALLVEEIRHLGLGGDVAELGVFRGDFASRINELFPNKTLFLFDTFEGFNSDEMQIDIDKGFLPQNNYFTENDFTNTDVNIVMNKMKYPDMCVVIQGNFPASLPNELRGDIQFCLVSLDVDIYIPTIEGLKYFYPRLIEGGYIMIHDYNNCDGVKNAVYEYEKLCGRVNKVPITDGCGSLIITK